MKPVVMIQRAAILTLAFGLLAAGSGWAQSSEQPSLGDFARQEKAKKSQQEKDKKSKKVISDEDLPHGVATSESMSSSTSQASEGKKEQKAEASESKEGPETATARGEAPLTKAQEAAEAKSKVEALKADEESSKKLINHLEELLASETSDSRRETYANALKHGQEHLTEVQKQLPEAEKEAVEKAAAAAGKKPEQQPEQPAAPRE